MRAVGALVVPVLLVCVLGCGGDGDRGATVDHRTDLASEETLDVTAHLVAVPGYEYVNVSDGEIGDVADVLERTEEGLGEDLFGGFSLHSVVADDPEQNTTRARSGDEVGFLALIGFNEPLPKDLEQDVASRAFGAEPNDVLSVAGTTVYLFIDDTRVDSRYTYVWFGGDHQANFDGAAIEPLDTWLGRYLAQPGVVAAVVPDTTPAPTTPTTVEPEESAPAEELDAVETGLLKAGGATDENIACVNDQLTAEEVPFAYLTDDPPDYGSGFDAAFTAYAAAIDECLPPEVNQAVLADPIPGDCFSEATANLGVTYSEFLRWLGAPYYSEESSELDAAFEACG